jgi:hypothetical protein
MNTITLILSMLASLPSDITLLEQLIKDIEQITAAIKNQIAAAKSSVAAPAVK